ncbi:ribosome maturation factor RimM [Paracoccus pacificus]|uniref:Ribosome maturation factor RimM n=1 Tax=Paracoccus pacificus TaxID=1463598 RepID=A0ABW4R943_9RHOB
MSQRVCLGAIAGAFGVQGEVRLKSFTSEPADIGRYSPLTTEDGGRSFTVRITRPVTGGFGARLSGVNTREEAEALKGVTLWAERDRLPGLPDDEFYHADLIGLLVLDTGGAELGRVRAIYNHGAGDILEIYNRGQQLLIPFTRAAVPTVDIEAGRIIADPPGSDE